MTDPFAEIRDEINALDLDEELEKQDDQDGPEETGDESPPAKDEPDQDPDDDSDKSDADDGESEDDEPEATDDSDAKDDSGEGEDDADGEDEDTSEQTVEIDGEQVPLSEVSKWRKDARELKARLTQVTQQHAEERKNLEAAARSAQDGTKATEELVRDLTSDAVTKKFLAKHPDALQYLIAEPKEARKLIGNEAVATAFWRDFEALKENPDLANRLIRRDDEPDAEEAVSDEVLAARNEQLVGVVWNGLDQAIQVVARERGIEDEEVLNAVQLDFLDMVGLKPEGNTKEDFLRATSTLASLVVRHDNERGYFLDDKLITKSFDLAASKKKRDKDRASAEADKHNKDVDAQLNDKNQPPKTPSGDGVTTPPEKLLPDAESLRDVMDAVSSLEIE